MPNVEEFCGRWAWERVTRNNVVSSITVAFQVVISLLINFCLSCCTRHECSEIRASTSQKQPRAYKARTIFESCRLVLMLLPLNPSYARWRLHVEKIMVAEKYNVRIKTNCGPNPLQGIFEV